MVFSDSDGEEAPPQKVIRIPYGESPGVWCRKDPDKFLDWQVVNLDLHGNQVETLTEEDKINLYNAIFRHLKMPPAELNSDRILNSLWGRRLTHTHIYIPQPVVQQPAHGAVQTHLSCTCPKTERD